MIRTWAATGILLAISSAAPGQVLVPDRVELDRTGNGIFEPGETVDVHPYWRSTAPVGLSGGPGDFSNFTGPAGATHTIVDGTATYLGWPPGAPPISCTPQDCYALSVAAATRPIQHWDATVLEGIWGGGVTTTWKLHIGATFADVPATSGFYRFVEAIVHKNVTSGCTTSAYCPSVSTTRDAMAVFVLVSKEAPGYVPPACGATPMFPDVPVTNGFCRWVEELARRGVVSGCGGGLYCPSAEATREQMAVFVLRTLDPTLNPPPCTTPVFGDVPASNGFCRWIEELFRRGVVTGCGGGNYCPTAAVTREQMSVFLTVTFGLTIYGV